jgi:hypothetical protein
MNSNSKRPVDQYSAPKCGIHIQTKDPMTCQNVGADSDIRAWSASKVDYTKAIKDRHTHVPSCLPGTRQERFSGVEHAIPTC